MKIALITNHNNYAGREYSKVLDNAKIIHDKIIIGEYPEHSEIEEKDNVYRFESLKSEELLKFLDDKKYDIAIQGGTGILKQNVISKFKFGIINFHPGDLPEYRGCMTPEWQIYEGRKVISTCHLIDDGIDSGDIIAKRELVLDYSNYNKMRGGIYPETAKFVVEIINEIQKQGCIKATKQDETNAKYRKVMESKVFNELLNRFGG